MGLKRVFQRASEVRQSEGITGVMKRTIPYCYRSIRSILPKTGYYTRSGIRVRERRLLDPIIPYLDYSDDPDYEWALISQLRDQVQEGDQVVVVGGGTGVSTVVAANQSGKQGLIIIFEADSDRVDQCKRTLRFNGVEDQCEVHHAKVGPAIHVPNSKNSGPEAQALTPGDLPDCDVLELDCEGAEREILQKMDIKPRSIIVETHPHFDAPPETIGAILEEKGYEIVKIIDRGSVPVISATAK